MPNYNYKCPVGHVEERNIPLAWVDVEEVFCTQCFSNLDVTGYGAFEVKVALDKLRMTRVPSVVAVHVKHAQ